MHVVAQNLQNSPPQFLPYVTTQYSRTWIIRTPVCHSNVKGVHDVINKFVRISELSDKYTI